MNPKGLASNRKMKKGGRAAVVPLGEVNPPPEPKGRGERRVSGGTSRLLSKLSKILGLVLYSFVLIGP